MMHTRNTTGERLKTARERRGWSQRMLAERSGVDSSTISRVESGETEQPDLDTRVKLCTALGIPLDSVFETGDGELIEMPPPEARLLEEAARVIHDLKVALELRATATLTTGGTIRTYVQRSCSACQGMTPDGASFCQHCGARLPDPLQEAE